MERSPLGSAEAFEWRQRAGIERAVRNITDLHLRVLFFVAGLIEDGQDHLSHAAMAILMGGVSPRTVREALTRGRALGLLGWEPRYRAGPQGRRRAANRYWLAMPARTPVPRPDIRRRRPVSPSSILPTSCSAHSAASPLALAAVREGAQARLLAKVQEEKRLRQARFVVLRERMRM